MIKPGMIGYSMVFLFCCSIQALGAPVNGEPELPAFDVKSANERFEQISSTLSSRSLTLNTLNQSIEQLTQLHEEAKECVENTAESMNDLNAKIKKYFGEVKKSPERVDADYLEKQKKALTKRQAECRLFVIRVHEALEMHQKTALSMQQAITFTRGAPIFERTLKASKDWQTLNWPKMNQSYPFYTLKNALIATICLLIAWFVSVYLKRYMKKSCRRGGRYILLNTVFIFMMLSVGALLIFMPKLFSAEADNGVFGGLMTDALWFIGLVFFYRFLFLVPRLSGVLIWYGFDVVFLKRLGISILVIYFIRSLGLDVLLLMDASDALVHLYEDIILLISLSAMVYFTLSLYHKHSISFKAYFKRSLLYKLLACIVLLLLTLDFIGYSLLAVNAAYILFSLLMVIALGTALYLGINTLYKRISYYPSYKKRLKQWFGYVNEPPYIELVLLRFVAHFVVLIGICFLFAHLIGEAGYFIEYILDYLMYGFPIAGFQAVPLQWLAGLVAFCVLVLLSRYIATRASHQEPFGEEEEKQVAMASILLYAGFSLSVIIGLIMAGFSFTSLTIIAGALSVGIGLGLQSVVNNFFSGLILLIEKPIRSGDRIKIDNIEGFVKKVRLRSTQVVTPSQEDIIIPNSDLITHQVTNFMFSDKFWRVKCQVGVAYGSDTTLVSDVMMEVACSHPEVVKDEQNQPMVLFREFGDSALIFELWCLIKDVNKKYKVASELNMALDKACREHDITIAFPQRDVHIKLDKSTSDLIQHKKESDE